jgi:pyruvate/2-oxoglutarate dehydrogenase complex dihydrolipoamide acyltransferase (E2) component
MLLEFKLPDLGEGLTEAEIGRWLVAEGDEIAEDHPLVEIDTDKTTVEIPSPYAGVVTKIFVSEGDVVPVGTVLIAIAGAGNASEPVPNSAASSASAAAAPLETRVPAGDRVRATPLVRRIAAELHVDLAHVTGTGPNGQIVERDVRSHITVIVPSEGVREAVRGVRRAIVDHLTKAHAEVPAVTFVEECDFTGVDVRSIVPLTLRAVAGSLRDYPELNARLEGDEIVYLDRYDFGVAVQTEAGLLVPVVRNCDARSLEALDIEVRRLAEAARAGVLKPEELRGSTFTVTSAGKLGGLLVTPLVNYPEVGILGIHRIGDRAVVRDGEVVIRSIGNISLTFDHRVVDGARAAGFCLDVINRLRREAA